MAMETPLQAARRHVRQSRRIVTRIERVVSKAKRDGHAFPEAEELLDSMRALLEAVSERVERHEYEVARTTTEAPGPNTTPSDHHGGPSRRPSTRRWVYLFGIGSVLWPLIVAASKRLKSRSKSRDDAP